MDHSQAATSHSQAATSLANSLINNMNILMIPFFLSHFFTKSVREYL